MCLAYNHSLSWSTLTTLAELSNSNQTAPWHSPTFGNPPTPLMSSNLSTTPAACVSGCFPQCLSNPSQPHPKNCKICHVKQEAASVRGVAGRVLKAARGVCVSQWASLSVIWASRCLSPCFLDYLMVRLPSPSAVCHHVPPDSLSPLTFLAQKLLLQNYVPLGFCCRISFTGR